MFGVPRFKEFSERDFMTLRVIESHRGSDDEQNQGILEYTYKFGKSVYFGVVFSYNYFFVDFS